MATTFAPPPVIAADPPLRLAPRLRRMRYEPEPGRTDGHPSPPPPVPAPVGPVASGAQLAEARLGVARVLRVTLEVLDGRRPATHLDGHVEEPVLRYLRSVARQRRVRSPARLRRMRVCLPRPGVAEVALACDIDGRVRAIAARFERVDAAPLARPGAVLAGWRCTALRLG